MRLKLKRWGQSVASIACSSNRVDVLCVSLFMRIAAIRGMTDEGERQWCLWKFADGEGKTYAGVSEPDELDASLESPADGNAVARAR